MLTRGSVLARLAASLAGAACLLLAQACGSDGPALPPASPPASPPSPPAAFVHVLAPPHVTTPPGEAMLSTFELLPTGELRLLAALNIEGARLLAADPLGQFLYVAGLRRQPGYLKSYFVDAATGALVQRADLTLRRPGGSTPLYYEPFALAAREREILLSRLYSYGLEVYAVDRSTGALAEGPAPYIDISDDPAWLVPHPSLAAVYMDDRGWGGSGILVCWPREDGRLVAIGSVRAPGDGGGASEAVLTRGCLVAAWQSRATGGLPASGGLSSFSVEDGTGLLAPADAVAGLTPGHLAATSGGRLAVTAGAALLLYATDPSCRLVPLATVPISPAPYGPGRLAFHPSGDLLYVDQAEGVRGYRLLDGGRLELLPTTAAVHGQIVVVPRP